jgi:hypothetical protein
LIYQAWRDLLKQAAGIAAAVQSEDIRVDCDLGIFAPQLERCRQEQTLLYQIVERIFLVAR